ncbi:MAG: hypothetical protein J6Q15_02455 [Clostridia bacterium]|nr:hypothetical protein [Clostridia bacterium]
MEVLFIVDQVKGLDKKISFFEDMGADIKFFVNFKLTGKVISNKKILSNMVSIYNNNINKSIDEYVKKEGYVATETLLYYSSVDINNDMINQIIEKIGLNPDTIYVKKKFNWWSKFKLWFYQKVIKLLFGMNDEYASFKLQYFSKRLMEAFVKTNFKNHIFSIQTSDFVEIEKEQEKLYYGTRKFNKNLLYNPIAFCLILICYVVLERFLALPFWVYFLVVALLLCTIINLIIMMIVSAFDYRYKK